MQVESRAKERDVAPSPIGSEELAEGLMLVRASTLKVVRFQLAMERQDRRGALEAVDDLVALDRRLQDYLSDVPAAAEHLLFRSELDAERTMLNTEKLALVAEVVRREPPTVETATVAEPDLIGTIPWEQFDFSPDNEHRPHRLILWFALGLALLAAVTGATWMLAGTRAMPSIAEMIR